MSRPVIRSPNPPAARLRPVARTYMRPMTGWWTKNPYFVRYMVREGSAVVLSVYALVLLAGLACLAQGEAAYEAWRGALGSVPALAFHLFALGMVGYHSLTWFQVMPKTAPQLAVDPRLITGAGIAAAGGLSTLLLGVLWWVMR